ncbi:MAG: hypothetical protein KC912_11625 [Proteobacteria bacterium]|nr:hypothetical protein [Pseudomonadota bacterium]
MQGILLLALFGIAHAADRAQIVSDLLDGGQGERARQRCEKWQADEPGAEGALRDQCARAFWPTAEEQDTPESWRDFRSRWGGTRGEGEALEREARAVLLSLGREASEDELLQVATDYSSTETGGRAEDLAAYAALRKMDDADDMRRVARRYRNNPRVRELFEGELEHLLTVDVSSEDVQVNWVDGVEDPSGRQPTAEWIGVRADDSGISWLEVGEEVLGRAGLDPRRFRREEGPPYPLCPVWADAVAPAVEVRVGDAASRIEAPLDPVCADGTPVFLLIEDELVRSLSLAPGHQLELANKPGRMAWGESRERAGAALWIPGQATEPMIVGNGQVVGQRVGPVYMAHPVAGGLPWLTEVAPPADALPLTPSLGREALPDGWTVEGQGTERRVLGGDTDWPLAEGTIRVLEPLVQWATQLSSGNPRVGVSGAKALPAQLRRLPRSHPAGTLPLALERISASAAADYLVPLAEAGLNLAVEEAWQLDLDRDPRLEILVRAVANGRPTTIVVDPYPSGQRRYFAFDHGRLPDTDPFAYDFGGRAVLAIPMEDRLVLVHVDDRGLARTSMPWTGSW